MKKTICLLVSVIMLLAALTPAAALAAPVAESAVQTIVPFAGDGVTLDYDASAFTLRCAEKYGLLVALENRTFTLNASFDEGWTFNPDYSCFFTGHQNSVTVTNNSDGTVTFVFEAAKGDYFTRDELNTIGIYATPAELPKLEITASVPFNQIDKETWVDATFTLTLGTKQFSGGDYEGAGSIKGRGNTSWGQPKKPYSIKLNSKASLLGIPKTKKYAIVPSYSDDSLLRNYMTYKAAAGYEGIDYVPRCEFV